MNVKNKLESFSRKVMGEAAEKSLKMMEEIDTELSNAIEEAKRQESQKADDELHAAAYKTAQSKNKELAAASMDTKKKLIIRRNELLRELFDGVERRIAEFTGSADYADYLIREIKNVSTPGLTVRLAPADMAHAQAVADAAGVEVQAGAEDMLGGFIAVKGRGVLDHSFRSRLEGERESFNLLVIK